MTNSLIPWRSLDPPGQTINALALRFAPTQSCRIVHTIEEAARGVAKAKTAILVSGQEEAVLADLGDPPGRAISEPTFEPISRGPRAGFTEILKTNLAITLRLLPDPDLRLEKAVIGRRSRTDVVVAWIEGVADQMLVREVLDRIRRIDINGVAGSAYIEEYIEDSPISPFPQLKYTERPERVQADLLEGRVAIFVDGTPMTLLAPATLWSAFESADDNFERPHVVTIIRWVRFVSVAITVFAPGLFVALTTFHYEMIPTPLALIIAGGRELIPFSALVEALLIETVFEIVREAGLRLPRVIGGAMTIVGPLVLGEAAVKAGLISPSMVIVVSLTAIASSAVPGASPANVLRLMRFPLLILAGTLGLFGIMWGVIALTLHLATLRSFGAPYLQPLVPLNPKIIKNIAVRLPRWMIKRLKIGPNINEIANNLDQFQAD